MKRIDQQEFERRIKQRFPEESFNLIEYVSIGKPAIIQCQKCKENIEVSVANNFLAKNKRYGCKNCYGFENEREKILESIKERYDIISTFVKDTHTYYHVKCKNCGHERTTRLNNFKNFLDCGCTTNVYRARTAEEFLSQANKNCIDGYYKLESEYINQTTKVLLRHSCGFIWSVRPGDVINGRSFCPVCGKKESKGARLITEILKQLNVNFEKEFPLQGSLQKFDFYLPESRIAIEYNGSQHYKENDFFQTALKIQQERDQRKRKYCKENDIILYEIPYIFKKDEIINKITEIVNSTTISQESRDKAISKQ